MKRLFCDIYHCHQRKEWQVHVFDRNSTRSKQIIKKLGDNSFYTQSDATDAIVKIVPDVHVVNVFF